MAENCVERMASDYTYCVTAHILHIKVHALLSVVNQTLLLKSSMKTIQKSGRSLSLGLEPQRQRGLEKVERISNYFDG